MDVVVRPALITDLEILHGIMEKEDWNSDIIILRNDLRCHPDGMLVAEDKQSGKILGMIMGLHFGTDYGFGCAFLVDAPYRGKGIGRTLWQERMQRMSGRNWAVDAVAGRIEANISKGFNPPQMEIKAYRWTAKPTMNRSDLMMCCPLTDAIMDDFIAYDAKTHPGGERGEHLRIFITMEGLTCRVAQKDGIIKGFLIAYPGDNNLCAAILKADTVQVADCLLSELSNVEKGNFSIQIPSLNQNAEVLIEKFNMEPWYILHRMWMGTQPNVDYSQVYGIPHSKL